MGFSVMLRGAEKLVPAEYWCPYGTKANLCSIMSHLNALDFSECCSEEVISFF